MEKRFSLKNYITVFVSLTLLLLHMIGSDFSVNEYFYSYLNYYELIKLDFNPLHFVFSSMIRPFMSLYFIGLIYFLNPDFFKEMNWPKVLFIVSLFVFVFYYSVIYTFGLYVIASLKMFIDISESMIPILNTMAMVAKNFLKSGVDAVMVTLFEIIRGSSIYYIFKSLNVNRYYLWMGIFIILFQILAMTSNFLEFFRYEGAFITFFSKVNLSHIILQYWILIALTVLCILKARRDFQSRNS